MNFPAKPSMGYLPEKWAPQDNEGLQFVNQPTFGSQSIESPPSILLSDPYLIDPSGSIGLDLSTNI